MDTQFKKKFTQESEYKRNRRMYFININIDWQFCYLGSEFAKNALRAGVPYLTKVCVYCIHKSRKYTRSKQKKGSYDKQEGGKTKHEDFTLAISTSVFALSFNFLWSIFTFRKLKTIETYGVYNIRKWSTAV